jgi:hypothetical protein
MTEMAVFVNVCQFVIFNRQVGKWQVRMNRPCPAERSEASHLLGAGFFIGAEMLRCAQQDRACFDR